MGTFFPCKLTILKESIVECFIQPTGDVFTSTAEKQLTNYPPAAPFYTFSWAYNNWANKQFSGGHGVNVF